MNLFKLITMSVLIMSLFVFSACVTPRSGWGRSYASSGYYGCKQYGRAAFSSVFGSLMVFVVVLWFFGDLHIHR